MKTAPLLLTLALAGCGPSPLTYTEAQKLAKVCTDQGLKAVFDPMVQGGETYWISCQDPKTGALFRVG